MPVSFNCQYCDRPYTVADSMAGKKAKCKDCGNVMDVPAQTKAEVPKQQPTSQPAQRAQAKPAQAQPAPNVRASKPLAPVESTPQVNPASMGLAPLQGSDLFAGTAPNPQGQLGSTIQHPGFANITPEQVAYQREMEAQELRDKKPTLDDYLDDDDFKKKPRNPKAIRAGNLNAIGAGVCMVVASIIVGIVSVYMYYGPGVPVILVACVPVLFASGMGSFAKGAIGLVAPILDPETNELSEGSNLGKNFGIGAMIFGVLAFIGAGAWMIIGLMAQSATIILSIPLAIVGLISIITGILVWFITKIGDD